MSQAPLTLVAAQYDLARRAGRLGVWRWDAGTGKVEWSAEIETFLGLALGSFEGTFEAFLNRVHPEDRGTLQSKIAEALEHGPEYDVEFRMLRKDGSICWVRGQGEVLRDEAQHPTGLLGAVWEISAQKRAEADRQFVLDLSARFAQISQPLEFVEAAVAALGRRLGATFCHLAEIDLTNRTFHVFPDFHDNIPSLEGTYPLDDFGDAVIESGLRHEAVAVQDALTDPRTALSYGSSYAPLAVRAFLSVPLHRSGKWVASLTVGDSTPRIWADTEMALVRAVAERLWPGFDNARLLLLSQETAQRLQLAQTAAKSVFWDWDVRSGETTFSSGYFALFGQPDLPGHVPYQEWLARIHRADLPGVQQAVADALAGSGEYECEFRVVWPDQSLHWLVGRGRVAFGKGGEPERVVSVNWDITPQKDAEEALRKSAQESAATFEQAAVGIARVGLDGSFQAVNQRLSDMLGYTRDELVNLRFQDITHPDDLDLDLAKYEALKAGRTKSYSSQKRYVHKDGRLVWIILTIAMVRDTDGSPRGAISVMKDITEERQTEQALRKTEEASALQFAEIEALYSTAPVGLAFFDREFRFIRVSQTMAKMNGRPVAEHLGRPAREILPEFGARMEETLRQVMESGEPVLELEIEGGTQGTWLANFFPLRDRLGRVIGVNSVVQDITGRKLHEAALREQRERLEESESQLLLALEGSGLGLWSRDFRSNGITLSDRAAAIFGLPAGVVENQAWAAMVAPEDLARVTESVASAFAGIGEYSAEYRLMRPAGDTVWLWSRAKLLRDDQGAPLKLVGVVQDITGRKVHEEALKEREEQLRAMVDSMNQLAWIAQPDGWIFWYNRRWYEYTGKTPEEMEGWGWQSVHDPEVLPRVMERWQASIRDRMPFEMEFPLRGDDGVFRWFLTRVAPVRDSQGKVIRWFGTNTEVDGLRRAQAELRESEQRFRELAEAVPDIVWSTDPQGSVDYFNPQWYHYSGQTQASALQWGWTSAIHPEDRDRVVGLWRHAVSTGEHFTAELRLRRHDGAFCWYLGRGRAMLDSGGRIRKWFGACTEVDQQKRIEEALRRSNEDLEQFAYAASHDLQEPLRMVSLYTELLGRSYRGRLDSEADQFIEYAVEGATRMNRLLKGLLEYSQAGDHSTATATIDTEAALAEAIQMLGASIHESGARIAHDPLPRIYLPETQLVQLFQNLIGNAIKYRGTDAPLIHVSAARQETFWRFAVRDNGIGIEPEYANQIFGVFKRLHKAAYPGTGIGLAICKRIVERAGGKIWVESRLGEGATFYFTLPEASLENPLLYGESS